MVLEPGGGTITEEIHLTPYPKIGRLWVQILTPSQNTKIAKVVGLSDLVKNAIFNLNENFTQAWAVIKAKRLVLISEDQSLNPAICNFYNYHLFTANC